MKKALLIIGLTVAAFLAVHQGQANDLGTRTSSRVTLDMGDFAGGFNVTVSTPSAVLISSSGINALVIWRSRTFQVTGTPYNVWMTTYPSSAWNSGAGWMVAGSTGSYTTRSQAAYYGILDPAAGSGTAKVRGPYEYQAGEVPAR